MSDPRAIVTRLLSLLNRIVFLDKRNVLREGEVHLFPSEIHALLTIAEDPETNVTELAGRLGVTKGAVSQTLRRLERKGVIEATKIPHSRNEVRITFTKAGRRTVNRCVERLHATHAKLEAQLATLTDAERKAIDSFLAAIEQSIE